MAQKANPYRSERLIYRALQDDDLPLIDAYQNDAWAFGNSSLGVMKPQGPHELQAQKDGLTKALLSVVVCLPAPEPTDTAGEDHDAAPSKPIPVGVICLHEANANWVHHRESSISVDIIAPYRGKGYGSEAINWVLQWGFQVAGLHRITIESLSYNEGAGKLYERLGFVPEGRKRKCIWFNGDWHDHLIFGILEDEWRAMTGNRKF